MASRRDELNAYTFARKRMVGAFLQPSGGGNDEDAPRPIKAVLPSVVVGAVLVAAFGMLGVISPTAPQGWDDGKNIIQGKDSTTRYVVLTDQTTGKKVLHQVLNMASARLVTPANAKVVIVADNVLDAYKDHGPTIGIPYAPDKLPTPDVAAVAKKWSVCDRVPSDSNTQTSINQSVFVTAGKDAQRLEAPGKKLAPGEWLFVEAPKSGDNRASWYLIDSNGYKHAIGRSETETSDNERAALAGAVFGADRQPQEVTQEWLDTLKDGDRISYPQAPDFDNGKVRSRLAFTSDSEDYVGRLLTYQGTSFYVVGKDKLYEVTAFQAFMIGKGKVGQVLYDNQTVTPAELSQADYTKYASQIDSTTMLKASGNLPKEKPSGKAVNRPQDGQGARSVLCSTFESMDSNGQVTQSVYADAGYPAELSSGSSSAYVSPGAGLVFRSSEGGQNGSGTNYLLTETGLLYQLKTNMADGAKNTTGATQQPAPQQGDGAQARLGYDKIQPVLVPSTWTSLVPTGPVLDVNAATKPQNY